MNRTERRLTKKFVLRNIAGRSFLIPLNKIPNKLVILNNSAAYIWDDLCTGHTIDWCVKKISDRFKICKEIIKSDIKRLLYETKNQLARGTDIKNLNRNLKTSRIPLQGSIELTGKCNLNCFHCYARGERDKKELQFQKLKRILGQLIENGCLFLQLTGGECLSRKDFKKIYLYIRRAGIIPTISTNATLFNDDLIETLRKYPPYYIVVSLYGAGDAIHDRITQTKGSFDKTLTNVIKLKKKGVSVWFAAVVFKENFSEIPKMKSLAKRIGVPIFFYPFLIPALNKDTTPLTHCVDDEKCAQVLALNKDIKFFGKTRQIKRRKKETLYPCNAGLQSFHIDSKGKLYLCKIERSIGFSLLRGSFKDSWRKLAEARLSKLHLPQSCLGCKQELDCEVCPPIMRLYESSGCGKIFCQRAKIKKQARRLKKDY